MPLSLTVSCFSKIQIGFTFLVPAHPGSPGQRVVKRVCVAGLRQAQSEAVVGERRRQAAQLHVVREEGQRPLGRRAATAAAGRRAGGGTGGVVVVVGGALPTLRGDVRRAGPRPSRVRRRSTSVAGREATRDRLPEAAAEPVR